MADQDKIMDFLKVTGPTIPSKVAKNIKQDILITSAHLADLKSRGKILISNLKIGGSPLYYLAGQESKLPNFIEGNVNPKDLQVLNLLKERKVISEDSLELLAKVALRSHKDFAIPLHVTIQGQKKLFWKWYLTSVDETNKIIGGLLGFIDNNENTEINLSEQSSVQNENVPEPINKRGKFVSKSKPESESESESEFNSNLESTSASEDIKPLSVSSNDIGNSSDRKIKTEPVVKKNIKGSVVENEKIIQDVITEESLSENIKKNFSTSKFKKTNKKNVVENKQSHLKSNSNLDSDAINLSDSNQDLIEKVNNSNNFDNSLETEEIQKNNKEEQQKLAEIHLEEKPKKPFLQKFKEKLRGKKRTSVLDEFSPLIESFFLRLNITIDQKDIIRKNSEMNLVVSVPSVVGKMKYFCKAKNKAKVDEKDISTAYMESQIKKLPLLFVYSNNLSSKAIEMLETGAFENTIVKKIK